MIIRHLYRRTVTKNGKKVKAWYYWYKDKSGKQVRKSCGENGKMCLLKKDAEKYLASLEDEDTESEKLLLKDFCKGMFDVDSFYLKKEFAKGHIMTEDTIRLKNRNLQKIIEVFGNYKLSDIDAPDIEKWLLSLPVGNSMRNAYMHIFIEVFKMAHYFKKLDRIPLLEYYQKTDKKEKGIFTIEEIKKLFPADYDEIIKIWKWPSKNFEPDYQIFSFATFCFTCLTTGMRRGEIQALTNEQFIQDDVIYINAMLNGKGERINHLKKGTEKNPRYRVVVLPSKTVQMIQYLKSIEPKKDNDYLFTYKAHPYKSTHLHKILISTLNKNGIDTKARNISLHSFRFTYNSIMRNEIAGEDLRMMLGHLSEKMTDYYDKSKITDHLPELLENKSVIDSVWN